MIAPGAATHRDVGLTAKIYRLSKFVVSGERGGNAEAITLQKLAGCATSFRPMRREPAGNPADLLMRMPGDGRVGGGDRRYRIRGINENLNTVTMDSNRIGSVAVLRENPLLRICAVGADTIEQVGEVAHARHGCRLDRRRREHGEERLRRRPRTPHPRSYGMIWRALNARDHPRRTFFSFRGVRRQARRRD